MELLKSFKNKIQEPNVYEMRAPCNQLLVLVNKLWGLYYMLYTAPIESHDTFPFLNTYTCNKFYFFIIKLHQHFQVCQALRAKNGRVYPRRIHGETTNGEEGCCF